MRKELIIALMVISVMFISGCDIYDTLYVKDTEEGEPLLGVPEGNISVEVGDDIVADVEEPESVDRQAADAEEVTEDVSMEGDATVVIVEETESINLVPQAQDPDQDELQFTFTSPLNENGQWQTDYGDAGEYTVTVTASDGTLTASRQVLIIVNKKEEAPIIESFSPEQETIEVDETEEVSFSVGASDLNNDELSYEWKLDGASVSGDPDYNYQTTYDDSGSHTVKVSVSDNVFDAERLWAVTVNNVNRNPVMEEIADMDVKETDTVTIEVIASDPDGDELSYSIDDERFSQEESVFTWQTGYEDAGEHVVTVTASDGTGEVSQEVAITVENVNRAPVIVDIVQQ